MATDITPEDRAFFEELIRKHPPYDSDDPILEYFDGPGDPMRILSTTMKAILDGKIE